MTRRLRLGVLASGKGSNLQAILDAARDGRLDADVAIVLSDRAAAGALERARAAGVENLSIVRGGRSREEHDRMMTAELERAGVDLVVLAGYMRILSAEFVLRWRDRVVNIHPALLPAFKGAHAVRDALAAGARVTGCTVHLVTEEMDAGPIVLQAAVPVREDDTEATLHARIHAAEHKTYPAALQLFAEGRIHVKDGRVVIEGGNGLAGAVLPEDAP